MALRRGLPAVPRLTPTEGFPSSLPQTIALVRTPRNLARRLAEGDSSLREITSKGEFLYHKDREPCGD